MLPIESALPELLAELETHTAAVLVAPPGAGKTTRVPLALLTAPWLAGKQILMLEPRRLAARAAAARMSATLGEIVGRTVGYQIRMDRRVSTDTRILVVTEGILTRMLQEDPALDGIGIVIFDEFHERSAVADTGLALTLASSELLRPDLRILVMSATINGAEVASLLGNANVVVSEGRQFPVTTTHHPMPVGQRIEAHVARVVQQALSEEKGSVLVFLPGAAEIGRVESLLAQSVLPSDVRVFPLHGTLPIEQQDAAIAPTRGTDRKVVLATNIAETSLTIEGIRVVVDSGWMRTPQFSPRTGMTRLETVRISRASADQRRGRAGRVEPGSCRRCWSHAEEAGFAQFARPELQDADLAPLALDLSAAGWDDPSALRWLDEPPAAAFAQARELLRLLGALDADGLLTAHGKAMAALGTHPRFAHLLLRAKAVGNATAARAASVVAILEERDLLRGANGPAPADLQLRLDAVERDLDTVMLAGATADSGLLARVREVAADWRRRLGVEHRGSMEDAEDLGLLLAWAYPDRVAQRRGGVGRFVLRNGRGAMLPAHDSLAHTDWLVAPNLDDAGREARIYLGASLSLDQIVHQAQEQLDILEEIRWDDTTRSVIGRKRTMLGALEISESAFVVSDEILLSVFLDGIRKLGISALPWSKGAIGWRARVSFLHQLDPRWPDLTDAALYECVESWLGPFLSGIRKFDRITSETLALAVGTLVPNALKHQLDTLAPECIVVPSGSKVAVDYADPARPVLAVRLQELFGMQDTPTVGGKVPVLLHLLSPGYQPVQVTQDLRSFWRSGYFDVRKDLRGRYPKHHWPEDPTTAEAVRGPKRRRT